MNKINNLLIILLFALFLLPINGQDNFLNNTSINEFLERQEVRGLIKINHHQKPYTRKQVSLALKRLALQKDQLSGVDREELNYFLSEYNISPSHPNSPSQNPPNHTFLEQNESGAFRFYEYKDSLFNFTLYPDIGVSYTLRNDSKNNLFFYNGLSGYGNIGNNLSFDFKFNDYSIKTTNYPVDRTFSRRRGFDYITYFGTRDEYNYDRTRASLTYSWDWGFVSLRKDYNYWGTGFNGNIILSDKAPSFPFVQLKLFPFEDVEFNYIHGVLNSMVDDSSTFRVSNGTRNHIELVQKYYVAHIISVNMFDNLRLSIGESIVYSDRFQPIYLVPFLFFRMADHYLEKISENTGNAQIFSSISWRIPSLNSRIDASIFIDELSFGGGTEDYPAAVAYSVGFSSYDFLFDNLGFQIEYSRINPAVYTHSDPAQVYSNRNYLMGHWIGGNGDQVYMSLSYKPIPLLYIKTSYEYTRRGAFDDITESRYQADHVFLYGDKSYYAVFSFYMGYELLNNLFIETEVVISNSWGENNVINVSDYKYQEATLGFRYGLD